MSERHRHGHAVVIGASVAGLLAARVLSEHFERVTVFDRDVLDDDAEPRPGVPQGRHAHALRNVGIIDGAVVTRYLADWERARITGVCVRGRHADALEDEVHADLVVDAGGRGSQTPQRLVELGHRKPPEAQIRIGFGYATREFERPPGARNWQSMYVLDLPPSRRGGLVFPIEGNRWVATLFGRDVLAELFRAAWQVRPGERSEHRESEAHQH